ncbi:MAG: hypothetical protein HY964_03625 [Ignavibacteriales bacterium]|nr:hypothetical protein [Ignavibacteriales bacterium]
MEKQEIKKLIPFYVAGTLSKEEHEIVKNAISISDELKENYLFWKKIKYTLDNRAISLDENHLSSDQIIGHVENAYSKNLKELQNIESHISGCSSCKEDIKIIRATYLDIESNQNLIDENPHEHHDIQIREHHIHHRYFDIFAAAAVILFLIMTATLDFEIDRKSDTSENRYVNLILKYQYQTRSESTAFYPTVINDSLASGLSVLLYLPHTEIDSILYNITLTTPSSKVIPIASGIKCKMSDVNSDTLRFIIDRKFYADSAGEYIITAKEILPKALSNLNPESYNCIFKIRKSLE